MRILIAEDEVQLARLLWQALEEEGYSVDVVHDGASGLRAAESGVYDTLILDLMLPELDGWKVLERLRASGSSVPVLLLTARDAPQDKIRGLDQGADDYLTKPFDIGELLARVRALQRRSAGQPSPIVHVGDVEIDTAARRVYKAGLPIALTPKEYALVELLVRQRGKLVTRTMIYDHIYDEADDTLSNVVDVYISNLRRKLGRDFVETRRGQGYLLHV